jgi:hypothetical protein
MNYKKIKEIGRWRIYKFDKKLTMGLNGRPIEKWGEGDKLIPKKAEYFIVSDANIHIERLVFPFWFLEGHGEKSLDGKTPCVVRGNYCAGVMTMMIHGGDLSTIRPDEEYLDELWKINEDWTADEILKREA